MSCLQFRALGLHTMIGLGASYRLRRGATARGALATTLLLVLASACGGKAGEQLRPKEATGAQALNENDNNRSVDVKACAGSFAEPLLVDIRSSDRADFDAAMKDGVAIVKFDCSSLRLLKGCYYRGAYSFVGVERSEDVVRMQGKDEVTANLPLSSARIGAEMKSGSTLDLALITVGKRRASVREVVASDLEGQCEGATHVVRGAYIGAFALGTGTVGQAKAVADLFGAGVAASSVSDKQAQTKSGDLEACRKSTSDAPAPPPQCGALTRLELMPISAKRKGEEESKKDAETKTGDAASVTCPSGMVWTGIKCANTASATSPGASTAVVACAPNDLAACEQKCKAGSGQSCYYAALALKGYSIGAEGKLTFTSKLPEPDPAKRRARLLELSTLGCNSRSAESCVDLAWTSSESAGDPKESDTKFKSAMKSACDLGSPEGCYALGMRYDNSSAVPDKETAAGFLDRGCGLGSSGACATLAKYHLRGVGKITRDPAKGVALYLRACEAGRAFEAHYCTALGKLQFDGQEIARDVNGAMSTWERGCKQGSTTSCYALGRIYREGDQVAKNPARALEYFNRGCNKDMPSPSACYALGDMLEKGEGTAKDWNKAVEAFQYARNKDSASRAAHMLEVGGNGLTADKARAQTLFVQACEFGDINIKVDPQKSNCAKAEAALKSDKDALAKHHRQMCLRTYDVAQCTKAKAAGSNITAQELEGSCKASGGDACKAWKLFGGNPSAEELKPKTPPRGAEPAKK